MVLDAAGAFVAREDLAFVAERVALEYDGRVAHGDARFAQDRARQNALVAAGWTVLRFTAARPPTRPACCSASPPCSRCAPLPERASRTRVREALLGALAASRSACGR